jgi:diguanylate cyclase (GGDEF)-like protein
MEVDFYFFVIHEMKTLHKLFLYLLSLSLLLIIGFVDNITGFEISFSIFYLIPIVIVSWYLGMIPGICYATGGAAIWLLVDLFSSVHYSFPIIPFWNMFVRLGFFIIISIILSRLKKALEKEREYSRIDYLTKSINLRSFMEIATRELHRLQRYGRPVTLIYLDCDNFKSVNDRFGHQTGNMLLQCVAATIRENIRSIDSVARLGGDEFAVLLPETDSGLAHKLVKRLGEALQSCIEKNRWPVTFSLGVATFNHAPDNAEEMLRIADDLMYKAKNQGKNRSIYEVFIVKQEEMKEE